MLTSLKSIVRSRLDATLEERIYSAKEAMRALRGAVSSNWVPGPAVSARIGRNRVDDVLLHRFGFADWARLAELHRRATPVVRAALEARCIAGAVDHPEIATTLSTRRATSGFQGNEGFLHSMIGAALFAGGDFDGAAREFELAIEASPAARTAVLRGRSLLHTAAGTTAAIGYLESACHRFPDALECRLALAASYWRAERTADANRVFDQLPPALRADFDRACSQATNLEALSAELRAALREERIIRPNDALGDYGYAEHQVERYWENLYFHFTARTPQQHGWSDLCSVTERKLAEWIAAHDIDAVVNFGVFCAEPDARLARRFPNVAFHGVDLQTLVKRVNEQEFSLPNLHFHALDLLALLDDSDSAATAFLTDIAARHRRVLLFHARTATLIYPAAMERFYRRCRGLGIRYIGLYENASFSRTERRYVEYGRGAAKAVPYFGYMFIHNFPLILGESGFTVRQSEKYIYSHLLWDRDQAFRGDSRLLLADSHLALLAEADGRTDTVRTASDARET